MTVTTHTYTAVVIGTPDVAVKVMGGTVTLDDTQSPHVQATLMIAAGSSTVWAAVSPARTPAPRVRLTATRTGGTAQSRTFNLGIRSRAWNVGDATVTLTLASDEALLDDFRPSSSTAGEFAGMLLTGYTTTVLGLAGLGSITFPASPDRDITPRTTLINQILNPSFETNTTSWAVGVNVTNLRISNTYATGGTYSLAVDAVAAGFASVNYSPDIPFTAGKFTASVKVRTSRAVNAQVIVRAKNSAGTLIQEYSTTVAAVTTAWTMITVSSSVFPVGTDHLNLYLVYTAGAAGDKLYADEVTVIVYDGAYPNVPGTMFTGATTTLSGYACAWSGAAHASTSVATPLNPITPDAILWPQGVSGIDFLAPLAQAGGLRIVCDENRAWTIRDATYTATPALTFTDGPGGQLIACTDTTSRDGQDGWADGVIVAYTYTDPQGIRHRDVDSYPSTPVSKWALVEKAVAAYPGKGFAQYLVGRYAARGRQVTVTAVADWRAAAEQQVTVTAGGQTIVGKSSQVVFDLDRDEMTLIVKTGA